ncbi:hypothetical protein QTP86_005990 [Hemibagrus guttatus]|nr:hypothetical protein QTP86_005990 [Hemibagrus guttatus]
MMALSPSLTARPIFLLAMCVIFYLAIVHPVTYMATKTWLRWEWLVITLVWIYTLAVNIAIVFSEYNHSHPVFMAMFLISLPITMYFNITTCSISNPVYTIHQWDESPLNTQTDNIVLNWTITRMSEESMVYSRDELCMNGKDERFTMENLTLDYQHNGTFWSCGEVDTTHLVLNSVLLFVSFPTTFVVIVQLLIRNYKARSLSAAEIFLLQINLVNVCLFLFNLLLFLEAVQVGIFSNILYSAFFSTTLTARPIFLLAMCAIFYLAIVHPVTYMTAKTWLHWEWLVVSLGWIYAMAVNIAIIVHEINVFGLIFSVLFYNTYLFSMFFNIATLRALSSSKPGIGGTHDPAKRKAFRIILGILVLLLLYYVPRMYYTVYPYIAPMDFERFSCNEGAVIMLLPKFSELSMPAIFLYSLHKLGVSSKADN